MKRSERKKTACGSKELNSPFPFPLRGKPGREGSPHAAQNAAPPTRGLRPLVNPLKEKSAGSLDTTRPSHGSRDRQGAIGRLFRTLPEKRRGIPGRRVPQEGQTAVSRRDGR
jgi:hypothetical protein